MYSLYILRDPREPLNIRYVGITEKPIDNRLAQHIKESKLKMSLTRPKKAIKDNNGTVYESIRAAAKILDIHHQQIIKVLKGAATKAKGYSFEYV